MKYRFLKEETTSQKLIENKELKETILLENNRNQVDKILEFFNLNTSVLIATGFLGTGKTAVIRHCLSSLNNDVIQLWANCYESTNLDDIFLGFFEEFKRLASQDIIKIPQARFESFSQRINAYFNAISSPIVIILNSYQALLAENAQIIIDFVNHISEFKNVKVIIISRNFNAEILAKSTPYEKINFKALDKDLFQKYITANKIRIHGPVFEEFYKLTKGYYFYTNLALQIMQSKNLSTIDLIQKQANSFLSVKEFLFSEFLSLVDSVGGHLLRFLTVIRYPVNTTLLQRVNLYDEQRLTMYAQNSLLEIENGNIYLKDYYKDITEGQIPPNVLVKLHRACAELYEMQLPKKPEERDLLISRRTIRQEIEYHNLFIPKRAEFTSSVEVYNSQPIILDSKPKQQPQIQDKPIEPPKPKELKDILFVFDEKEENTLLAGIATSINNFLEEADAKEKEENEMSAEELINLINDAENNFNYKRVISLCEKVFQKNDVSLQTQALIHTKIANAASHIADAYNALKHYTKAQQIYSEIKDKTNEEEALFQIAAIKNLMFKRNEAKNILFSLTNTQNKDLKIKINLLLFDIYMEEGDENKAFETCKTAIKLIDKTEAPNTICELLFKCGLILETRNNTCKAIEAYEKALKFNNSPEINSFLPQIYSNLTTLYAETDDIKMAEEYGKKALLLSETEGDLDAMYRANLKLSQLDTSSAKTYLTNSLDLSYKLDDNFYIITALLNYGDYLYGEKELIEALKKYFEAYKIAKNNFMKENIQKIERRILDVKYRLNEEDFNKEAKLFNYEK